MHEVIVKALYQGIADLINAFVASAKKHGFSIMLSLVVAGIFGWRSLAIETGCEAKIERLEERMEASNAAWSASLNEARRDWYTCDSLRHLQAVEIAELKVEIRHLKNINAN